MTKLICMGDSNTLGAYVSTRYSDIFESSLDYDSVVNVAVGGYTSTNILSQASSVIAQEPTTVTIMIGTNDVSYTETPPVSVETFESNLNSLVSQLKDEGIKVCLLSCIAMYGETNNYARLHMPSYLDAMKRVARDNNVGYIPVYEGWCAENFAPLTEVQYDALYYENLPTILMHASDDGHAWIANFCMREQYLDLISSDTETIKPDTEEFIDNERIEDFSDLLFEGLPGKQDENHIVEEIQDTDNFSLRRASAKKGRKNIGVSYENLLSNIQTDLYSWVVGLAGGGGSGALVSIPPGRLSLDDADPTASMSADQSNKSELAYPLYNGNQIMLWVDDAFYPVTISNIPSISNSGFTTSMMHDIFAYQSGGNCVLEKLAWSSNSARATEITRVNGRLVKSGDSTRLFLGSVYVDSNGYFQDTRSQRCVSNAFNLVELDLLARDPSTSSWAYTTPTFRASHENTTIGEGRFTFALCLQRLLDASSFDVVYNASGAGICPGIGIDKTDGNDCELRGSAAYNIVFETTSKYNKVVAAGFHYAQHVEYSAANGTTYWRGVYESYGIHCGIAGKILG